MTTAVQCPTCSTDNAAGDAFCGGCGSPVGRAAPTTPEAPVPRPRPGSSSSSSVALARIARLAEDMTPFPARVALSTPGPMCPACGADVAEVRETCPACGDRALTLPARWMWAVGGVHRVRRGLRQRLAVCVHSGPEGSTLLLPDGSTVTVPGETPVVEPPLPRDRFDGLRSSPGILLRYATAQADDLQSVPWPEHALVEAAVSSARSDRILGRLVALDALELGRPDLVEHLGLPPSEARWLRLIHAARNGHVQAVVEQGAALPPGRYRGAVAVYAALLPAVCRVPGSAGRLRPVILPFVGREPLADVVARALGLLPADDTTRWQDLDARARRYPMPGPLRDQVVSLLAPTLGPPSRPELLGPGARQLFAHLHPAAAAGLLAPEDLTALDTATLDDLVDAGPVGRDLLDAMPPGRARAHLRARLAPETLQADELDSYPAERGRRALLDGSGDPREHGGRLAALTALRQERWEDVAVDELDPADRPKVQLLLSGRENPRALLDPRLLVDRTLWPGVTSLLGAEHRVLDDEARRRVGEFAAWVDLHDAREHLYLARWDRAADAARRCLSTSADESVRDEALNLLACALHHRGDGTAAVAALEKAIEGQYSPALLANLAVIAGELSPEAAAPHLARIVREAERPALRRQAALLALRMWRGDPTTWDGDEDDRILPPVLRGPLRAVVVDDMPLEDFRSVVTVLALKDADWLRTPNVLDRSPHRHAWAARFALAFVAGHSRQVALFATVSDWSAVPDWLVAERDRLVELVWDGVAADLDDGANDGIELLEGIARKVSGLSDRQKVLVDLLTIAMTTLRAIEGKERTPDGAIDLWRGTRRRVAALAGDELVTDIDEVATRRLANIVCVDFERRVNKATNDYDEWLERVQRTISYHNKAVDVFAASVRDLEKVRGELREWRSVSDHPGTREMYDTMLARVDRAIPHIRRQILPKLDFLT